MALSGRFHWVYRKLSSAFNAYDRTGRTPEDVPELVERRARLDDARREMQGVRTDEGLVIRERSSPRFIDPRQGLGSTSLVGKVAAALGVVGLAIGLLAAISLISVFGGSALELHDLQETLIENGDGTCNWVVDFELENTTDVVFELRSITLGTSQRSPVGGRLVPEASGFATRELGPSQRSAAGVTLLLSGCPERTSDIRHGALVVTYGVDGLPVQASFGV